MQKLLPLAFTLILLYSVDAQTSTVVNFGVTGETITGFDAVITQNGDRYMLFRNNATNQTGIAKYNSNYTFQWSLKLQDNTYNGYSRLIELSNGDVAGVCRENLGQATIFRIKPDGTLVWNKVIDPNSSASILFEIKELPNQTICVTGNTDAKTYVAVLDTTGTLQWCTRIAQPGYNFNIKCLASSPNEIAVFSDAFKYPDSAVVLVSRFDLNGNLLGDNTYLLPVTHHIYYSNAIRSLSGDYYAIGRADTNVTLTSDYIVSRFDASGNFLNSLCLGTDDEHCGYGIAETADGDFLYTALAKPQHICGGNLMVGKLTASLDTVFTKFYGDVVGEGTLFPNLKRQGNTFYSAGSQSLWSQFSLSDGHLLVTDESFALDCEAYSQAADISLPPQMQLITPNFSYSSFTIDLVDNAVSGTMDLLPMDACSGQILGVSALDSETAIQVYPNPTEGQLNIGLGQVYQNVSIRQINILGQLIKVESFNSIENISTMLAGDPGLYQLEVELGNEKKVTLTVLKK